MSALGELMIICIYGLLGIFVMIALGKLIWRKKEESKIKRIIWLVLSIALLILFSYSQYKNHRSAELEEVGTYHLTNYPNCSGCLLELKKDNTYIISIGSEIREKGNWHYESGGDYWITYIGESGQLGNDIYKYDNKKPK